ncbi:LLM class flavin-dependent oxidoreductase [Nocardioides caldifontis]|uniref:LLM class flavin-dependent oxidoreductase n=1 Tax=Nocardioides caldifontis TaxID=2588938 RepID=UPI001396A8D6|nr:LLM class flavin-dependent oxidoreductase [Nocardioides caldifontis]MCK5926894.1 LLM class flavin-dependent oxidoreductase [Nocardioides sp.]
MTQPLRFGVGLNNFGSPLRTASDVVGSAVLAEELGYSSVWFGDHLSFHVPLYECLSMMAATAVVTREVTVASGVLLGVLRHPAWVAKSVATIDALSEGRVLLGLGVGGENRAEFELADVPMAERGRRTTELMGSLREMWRPDNPHGLQPPPVQSRIPLWHGGRADAALARTARFGDGWLGAFVTPERYAERWSALLAMAADAGRAPEELTAGLHVYIRVDDDADRAWRDASAFIGDVYAMDPKPMRRYCIAGDVDQCAEEIATFVEAGVTDVICRIAGSDLEDQMPRIMDVATLVRARFQSAVTTEEMV